jgi:cytochrome bd-type quinol oxidase subunit 2
MDEKPVAETQVARRSSWILFAAVAIYAAWAVYRIYHQKYSFTKTFEDLKISLPFVTTLVTHAAYPLAIPVVILAGFVANWRIRDRSAALVLNGVLLVLVMLLLDIYLFGITEPFTNLMDSLQGPGKPR